MGTVSTLQNTKKRKYNYFLNYDHSSPTRADSKSGETQVEKEMCEVKVKPTSPPDKSDGQTTESTHKLAKTVIKSSATSPRQKNCKREIRSLIKEAEEIKPEKNKEFKTSLRKWRQRKPLNREDPLL